MASNKDFYLVIQGYLWQQVWYYHMFCVPIETPPQMNTNFTFSAKQIIRLSKQSFDKRFCNQ